MIHCRVCLRGSKGYGNYLHTALHKGCYRINIERQQFHELNAGSLKGKGPTKSSKEPAEFDSFW